MLFTQEELNDPEFFVKHPELKSEVKTSGTGKAFLETLKNKQNLESQNELIVNTATEYQQAHQEFLTVLCKEKK